jgi:hypothetical protein
MECQEGEESLDSIENRFRTYFQTEDFEELSNFGESITSHE